MVTMEHISRILRGQSSVKRRFSIAMFLSTGGYFSMYFMGFRH